MRDVKFRKVEGETDISYIVRMCDNKDVFGLSWKELADEINATLGQNYDESAYRKKYQYYKMCQIDSDRVEADRAGVLEELDDRLIELKKETYKIQTLRMDNNKKIREQSRNDLYFEEVIRAIRDKQNENTINFKDRKKILDSKENEQYVLCFSDVHFGKIFESINNRYDIDICFERFQMLLDEIIYSVQRNKISKLIICALGDLIEGMTLRCSQLQSLQIGMVDQTIKFTNMLIDWLRELSKYTEIDYYSVMSSNHSQIRPFGSKPNEFVSEDMERVILAMLTTAFENDDRVNIITTEEKYQTLEIYGYKIILLHGHEIKEVKNTLQTLSWQYRTFFDYAIMGHLHHNGVTCVGEDNNNNCEIINCPSIMGSDEYADSLGVGSKASAILLKFTPEQGKRSIEDIILN